MRLSRLVLIHHVCFGVVWGLLCIASVFCCACLHKIWSSGRPQFCPNHSVLITQMPAYNAHPFLGEIEASSSTSQFFTMNVCLVEVSLKFLPDYIMSR